MSTRIRRTVARIALAMLMTVPVLVPASVADAAPARAALPHARQVPPVPGKTFIPRSPAADPTAGATMRKPRAVAWPKATTAETAAPGVGGWSRPSDSVVAVGRRAGGNAPARVRLAVTP